MTNAVLEGRQRHRDEGPGVVPADRAGEVLPTSKRVTKWTWQSLGNGPDITNIAVNGSE
jgi:hypothetical protein